MRYSHHISVSHLVDIFETQQKDLFFFGLFSPVFGIDFYEYKNYANVDRKPFIDILMSSFNSADLILIKQVVDQAYLNMHDREFAYFTEANIKHIEFLYELINQVAALTAEV